MGKIKMIKHIFVTVSLILGTMADLTPADVPRFLVDFDKPASERYVEIYEHFKEDIIQMEAVFYKTINEKYRGVFVGENLEKFKMAQPDTYDAMASLSNVTGLPI